MWANPSSGYVRLCMSFLAVWLVTLRGPLMVQQAVLGPTLSGRE